MSSISDRTPHLRCARIGGIVVVHLGVNVFVVTCHVLCCVSSIVDNSRAVAAGTCRVDGRFRACGARATWFLYVFLSVTLLTGEC